MGKYYYVKSKKKGEGVRFYLKITGICCIFFGVFLFAYFFFPLVSYQFFFRFAFASSPMKSPIPEYLINEPSDVKTLFASGFASLTKDYTDARNWYGEVKASQKDIAYTLSIPKLKIEHARVRIDYDLSKHLVHYSGNTQPGERGNTVIFGHSSFPYFFNPADYTTIFATLHTLEEGDEILLSLNSVQYRYKIVSMFITDPEDISIFTPSSESLLTLVTCTPPGTVWKRLIVQAKLQGLI